MQYGPDLFHAGIEALAEKMDKEGKPRELFASIMKKDYLTDQEFDQMMLEFYLIKIDEGGSCPLCGAPPGH